MSTLPVTQSFPFSHFEQLRQGRAIVRHEADALLGLASRLDGGFCDAVGMLCECRGSVVVTGIGKAGLIGQKIAATLSSTGTRAHFLHPVEAVHGDLGRLHDQDVVLALSNSGETEEVCRLLPAIRRMNIPLIAITASDSSTLGSQADVSIPLGRLREAGPNGLAPSTSTTAMLALGDALALVVGSVKEFTPQQFAVFHPGGSLGRKLTSVHDVMRQGDQLRTATEHQTVRDIFAQATTSGRRTGAIVVVDSEGRLTGIFTDSDFVRLLEQRRESQLDRPIVEVMTANPLTIDATATLADAVDVLSEKKVSELPVVDGDGHPIGLIDITDVIGLVPREATD